MRIAFKTLLLAAALGLGSAAHGAEPAGHAAHHPPAAAPAPAPSTSGNPSGMPGGQMMGGGSMMGGSGMMGGGMMGMGAMSCAGMAGDRLAALQTELALTPAQLPLWNAFADAAQAMGQGMGMQQGMGMAQGMPIQPGTGMQPGGAMAQGMPMQPAAGTRQGMPMQPGTGMQQGMGMMGQAGSLPERLDRQETMLAARLDAVRKLKAALSPLYAALTPEQRTKVDTAMCGPQGR